MLDIKWELILYTFRDNLSKSCVIKPPSYLYVTEISFLVLYPLFNKKYGVLEHFPYKGVSRFLERDFFVQVVGYTFFKFAEASWSP